jgi:hypothetical protein
MDMYLAGIHAQPFPYLQALGTSRSAHTAFFLQVKRNRILPFWEHPTIIRGTQHLTIPAPPKYPPNTKTTRRQTLMLRIVDNNDDEDEGEDNMVDTMAGTGVNDSGTFREHFEGDIATRALHRLPYRRHYGRCHRTVGVLDRIRLRSQLTSYFTVFYGHIRP